MTQGEPERAAAYRDEQALDVPFLCDPGLDTYRVYGLLQFEVPQVLFDAPAGYWSHDREHAEQLRQARRDGGRPMVDDPWRQPGEFVIDADGKIRPAAISAPAPTGSPRSRRARPSPRDRTAR